MKKIMFIGLTLLLLGSALFADDAKVMPAMVGRFYLSPSYAFSNKAFDKDGDRVSSDTLKALNLGAALEFGVIDWVTAAVQWLPGANVWSDVDTQVPNPKYNPLLDPPSKANSSSSVNANGVADLFIGAKIQILGTAAPIKTDRFRLSFGPGIKVPLPGPDYKKQDDNAAKGDDVTAANIDTHVLGAGLRTYFDYIINDNFFINLYNETIFYPMKQDMKKAGYIEYALVQAMEEINGAGAGVGAPQLTSGIYDYGKVNYGYDLTFELEPVFNYNIAEGVVFGAGLPINYYTTPGVKYDTSFNKAKADNATATISGIDPTTGAVFGESVDEIAGMLDGMKAEQTHLLTVRPNVSLFFMGWALPMEFKLSYFVPVWGKNESATNTINFQIRAYFKI